MASRRDQLMSYQFVIQRVVSALVMREADPAQAPFRRGVGAVFAGLMVALIAVAGVGVYGLVVKGGNKTWRAGNSVIMEEETGARYIFNRETGVLHPVLNSSSARMILGAPAPIQKVSRKSLIGIPRGQTLGIAGAPDAMPDPKQLSQADWTLCSRPDKDISGSPINSTVLYVGSVPSGGKLLGDAGLLVEEQKTKEKHLIWNHHRHLLREPDTTVGALGIGARTPLPVGRAWLNGIPLGEDVKRINVGKPGDPSNYPDALVGQVLVFETEAGNKQYYAALADGIAEITQFQALLILGDDAITSKAYPSEREVAIPIGASDANRATKSKTKLLSGKGPTALPATLPDMATPASDESTACASFADSAVFPEMMIEAEVPTHEASQTQRQTPEGAALADRIVVGPGTGAMVHAYQGEPSGPGQLYLITDQGKSFAVPNMAVMLMILGPEGAKAHAEEKIKAVRLPESLVLRVPLGPGLNPDAARKAAPK